MNKTPSLHAGARVFSYPVTPRQGIPKDPDLGGEEGKHHEQRRDHAKSGNSPFRAITGDASLLKEPCLVQVRHGGRDKEKGDVEPIGGPADDPVIGVEKDGDQDKPQEDPAELHAPKIPSVTEEEALRDGIEEHRPEKELHMLPGGFVHPRKGGDPDCLPQPIVEEMQKRAPEGGHGEAEQLPQADGAVHRTPRFFVTVYARDMSPIPTAP